MAPLVRKAFGGLGEGGSSPRVPQVHRCICSHRGVLHSILEPPPRNIQWRSIRANVAKVLFKCERWFACNQMSFDDDEPVDPKAAIELKCQPKCQKTFSVYTACVGRLAKLPAGSDASVFACVRLWLSMRLRTRPGRGAEAKRPGWRG